MATLILLTRSPQVCESRGLCAFFDRSDLLEISEEALRDKVLASKVVITVLDPHTFNSEWVRLENEWAARAGVPIVPVFDEDRWDWKGQLDKWQRVYPSFFTRQAVTVSKAFRRQSMQKLMQAARPDCLVILSLLLRVASRRCRRLRDRVMAVVVATTACCCVAPPVGVVAPPRRRRCWRRRRSHVRSRVAGALCDGAATRAAGAREPLRRGDRGGVERARRRRGLAGGRNARRGQLGVDDAVQPARPRPAAVACDCELHRDARRRRGHARARRDLRRQGD